MNHCDFKRAKHLFLLGGWLAILLLPVSGSSQTDSLSYYFDDQGISNGIMIKTDLISIIHGDAPLLVEGTLVNDLRWEAGVGLLLPYYVHDFLALVFSDNRGITNDRLGYSSRLHMKWYDNAPEEKYWGIQYYRKAYHHITVNDWFFTRGDQRIIGKRLLLDIALGLGVRTQKAKAGEYIFDPDFTFMPIVPLMVKFGFIPKS